jgi:hypothetical protein
VRDLFHKLFNRPVSPIILLVVICLVAGFLTFQDYGMGWDEPLFYKYADAIPYAYSITERLSGDFNILKAYGPSETDHMMYGPAYLLAARPFVQLTMAITGSSTASAWHMINFILFIVGVVFTYMLALKWLTRWAAFSAALLFVTQPLLWGHAFINPKDIPFTVLFIIAFYLGYVMVEKASAPNESIPDGNAHPRLWRVAKFLLWMFFILLILLSSTLYIFKTQIQTWIPAIIQFSFENPNSFSGTAFRLLANNMNRAGLNVYITKGISLFNRMPLFLYIITVFMGSIAVIATFKPKLIRKSYAAVKIDLNWWATIIAGFSLGFLTAIRILGPFAGFLVALFFIFKFKKRSIPGIVIYGVIAFVTMYILWPYVWRSPIGGLLAVITHMANNPQNVPVLFNGQILSSKALPVSYFFTMLGYTLTEPVWILFFAGAGIAIYLTIQRKLDRKEFIPFSFWFLIPFAYVIISTPPQYDGFRHFTFILPPVFITAGFAFNLLFEKNKFKWLNPLLVIIVLLPGIVGIVKLHPYEYTYYNSFVGGTNGAFRRYETDYWLTCYKEVFDQLNKNHENQHKIYIHKNKYLASQYAGNGLQLEQFVPDLDTTAPGDLLLLSSRSNYDRQYHVDDPSLITIAVDGAVFCTVKRVQ